MIEIPMNVGKKADEIAINLRERKVDHFEVPNGTGPGVQKSNCSLSACHGLPCLVFGKRTYLVTRSGTGVTEYGENDEV